MGFTVVLLRNLGAVTSTHPPVWRNKRGLGAGLGGDWGNQILWGFKTFGCFTQKIEKPPLRGYSHTLEGSGPGPTHPTLPGPPTCEKFSKGTPQK